MTNLFDMSLLKAYLDVGSPDSQSLGTQDFQSRPRRNLIDKSSETLLAFFQEPPREAIKDSRVLEELGRLNASISKLDELPSRTILNLLRVSDDLKELVVREERIFKALEEAVNRMDLALSKRL